MEWMKNADDGELYPFPDDSEQKAAEKIPGYLAEAPKIKSIENDFENNIAIVNLQKELADTQKELVSVKKSQSITLEKAATAKKEDKHSDVSLSFMKKIDWRACIIVALSGLLITLTIRLLDKNTYAPEIVKSDNTTVSYSDTVDENTYQDTPEEQQIQPETNSDSQKSDNNANENNTDATPVSTVLTVLLKLGRIFLPIWIVMVSIRIGIRFITNNLR